MGKSLSLVIGGLNHEHGLMFAAASVLLQIFVRYRCYAPALKFLSLSLAIRTKCACKAELRSCDASCIQSAARRMHSNSRLRKLTGSDTTRSLKHRSIVARHRVACRWSMPQIRQTNPRLDASRCHTLWGGASPLRAVTSRGGSVAKELFKPLRRQRGIAGRNSGYCCGPGRPGGIG